MATTYDKASLVMIPSGYKDDKLFSIKPTDGSGDFTFSRDGAGASPATRVNASGLIEKGRENLILQSNTFSNAAWSSGNLTLTSGQAGYDGTNNAWEIEVAVSGNYRSLTQASNTSGIVTNSIYAKAGNSNYLGIVDTAGQGSSICIFDLTDGSVSYQLGGDFIETSSELVGNGWYRLKVTHKGISPNYMLWFVANASNSTGGDIGNSVFIQNAQQEQSLVATDYIETTTAPVSAGLLGDMPRLDYSGGATCPSLLLEPSRVNLAIQSEYIGSWNNPSGITITDNAAISPEGVQNAAYVQFASGNQYIRVDAIGSSATYTGSVYIKGTAGETIQLAVTGTDSGLKTLTGDWDRIEFTSTGASTHLMVHTFGGATARNIYVWGAQVESGSYPTSYIPTYGSASTRGVDYCEDTTATDLIGQTEGTLYAEFDFIQGENANYAIIYNTGFSSYIYINQQVTGEIYGQIRNIGIVFSTAKPNGRYKCALAYKSGDSAFFINGEQVGTTSSTAFTLNTMTNFQLGRNDRHSSKQALLFKTRLTNAELAALTTL